MGVGHLVVAQSRLGAFNQTVQTDISPRAVVRRQNRIRASGDENGGQALEVAAAEKPDVILLDIMMPGMDGIEVCRRLKADPNLMHIPVIMVSAKGEDEAVINGLEQGQRLAAGRSYKVVQGGTLP